MCQQPEFRVWIRADFECSKLCLSPGIPEGLVPRALLGLDWPAVCQLPASFEQGQSCSCANTNLKHIHTWQPLPTCKARQSPSSCGQIGQIQVLVTPTCCNCDKVCYGCIIQAGVAQFQVLQGWPEFMIKLWHTVSTSTAVTQVQLLQWLRDVSAKVVHSFWCQVPSCEGQSVANIQGVDAPDALEQPSSFQLDSCGHQTKSKRSTSFMSLIMICFAQACMCQWWTLLMESVFGNMSRSRLESRPDLQVRLSTTLTHPIARASLTTVKDMSAVQSAKERLAAHRSHAGSWISKESRASRASWVYLTAFDVC